MSAPARRCLATAVELMSDWDKTPVRCASTPGFIVNRVARPFYGEAQRLLMAGVADAATLDAALRRAGFRMGPLELTDLIGQDVNLAVGTSVWEQTGHDPRYAPTSCSATWWLGGGWAARRARASIGMPRTAPSSTPTPTSRLAEELVGGPVETDPVARTLAMLVNEAVDLVHRGEATRRGRRHRDAVGHELPPRPHRLGRRARVCRGGRRSPPRPRVPRGRYRPSPALALSPISRCTRPGA